MTEYIDHEKALAFPFANGNYDSKNANADFIRGCESYREYLESIPAADVRPVVRGENVATDYDCCDQFVCSNCGIELRNWVRVERDDDNGDVTYHEHVFNFCPNCGADMRGDEDADPIPKTAE